MRERYRDIDSRQINELTVDEFKELINSVIRQQLNNHYKGLVMQFFDRWDKDNEALLDGMDQVIGCLKLSDKPKESQED